MRDKSPNEKGFQKRTKEKISPDRTKKTKRKRNLENRGATEDLQKSLNELTQDLPHVARAKR